MHKETERETERLAVLMSGGGSRADMKQLDRVTSQTQRLDGVKGSADQAIAWKF